MKPMKKKTKKRSHSKTKRIERNLKGFVVECWDSITENDLPIAMAYIRHPILGDIKVGAKEWDRVHRSDRKWKVQVFVKCIAPDNTEYTEEAEIIASRCRLNDLTELYKRMLQECRDAVNPKHIQDTGWRAEVLA